MKRLKAALLPFSLMLSFGTYAQASDLSEGVGRCIKIDNDIARLQCFDKVTTSHLSKAAKTKAALKQWRVGSEVDPISDEVTTILVLDEVRERESDFGYESRHKFFLRCTHRTLEIGVIWGVTVDEGSLRITSRVGNEEAKTNTWNPSINPNMTFYPKDENEFFYRLLQSDRLAVRMSRDIAAGGDLTSVFEISGLEEASKQMLSACPAKEPLFH